MGKTEEILQDLPRALVPALRVSNATESFIREEARMSSDANECFICVFLSS